MAEVVVPGHPHHHRHTSSINAMMTGTVTATEPTFEMVPNPTFSFPMKPVEAGPGPQSGSLAGRRRPMSMHLGLSPPAQPTPSSGSNPHRRTTSALPSFSFNAADATGLKEEATTPKTPDTPEATTPRRGHRRGGSEFVGGDSRFGVNKAISNSPTKTSALQLPLPTDALPIPQSTGRRGHAHKRSGAGALSSHDVRSIMQPADPMPRLSSSLPSTPMDQPVLPVQPEHPALDRSISIPVTEAEKSIIDPERDSSPSRPVSRPRVGFSDNVEIIPRPLSTISSETEGSMSTARGHSLNNSISSMISMGSPSPPSARHRRELSITNMDSISEQAPKPRSSSEISKRIEKEGEWLKSRSSNSTVGKASETSTVSPTLTFASSETPATPRVGHRRRQSGGQSLGFDRRRSEPSMSMRGTVTSRLSALSLQEHVEREAAEANEGRVDRKSSTRRLKDWARAKLHRRSRDWSKGLPEPSPVSPDLRPVSASSVDVAGKVPMYENEEQIALEPAMAETDLDAVFNTEASTEPPRPTSGYIEPLIQFNTPVFSQPSYSSQDDSDDMPMVDLDAALGPMRTPPLSSAGQRKTLHSAARANVPQSNYFHRRAESAPVLTPFDASRVPQSSAMADVFEEEEEDDTPARPFSQGFPSRSDAGIGISIVDASSSTLNFGVEDSLRALQGEWEPERPTTSYGPSSRLSTPLNERRASSIIEQTIMEEVSPIDSPVQQIEIVEDHEEPRASSLTKSSESSDTSTILGRQSESLPLPGNASSVMTPETYQASTFSSPDFARHQGSFDTSRLGTSASSITDNRTTSSCATGEPTHDRRVSVDDVPSLTSSRSTMMSTAHANTSRRDLSAGPRSSTLSNTCDSESPAARRSKRASIQSLSQLVGGSFERKTKPSVDLRPKTAHAGEEQRPVKKEHRLKKLMFWKSKQTAVGTPSTSNKLQKERNGSS